ncbi:MAG: hypothetical protein HPAVJP_3550 [Candidatus Hepatoplasma vulgare]|nr:MAG: hypothetical protein HPAVJP_3550 [Candidatus Hepatoplasma sp.]
MKKNLLVIIFLPIIFFLQNFIFLNKNVECNYLSKNNSILVTEEQNPYIESGPIIWYPNEEEDSINFELSIHDNDSHDFFTKVKNEDGISMYIIDYYVDEITAVSAYSTFECINMPVNPVDNYKYIFEIDMGDFALENYDSPYTNWEYDSTYSLNYIKSNILAVDSYYNVPTEELYFSDFGVINRDFQTTIFNPYIVGKSGFEILNTNVNSVQFQIKAINDYEENYDFENSTFNIKLNNIDSGEEINTTAIYVGTGEEKNTYIYEINGLTPNTNYEILSLDNTNLSALSPYYENDSSISISDSFENGGLNSNGSFYTINENNPYIEERGFDILTTTENSVEFQIAVIENKDISFDPKNSLNVTINDSLGNSINKTANYIEEESSGNNYVYEITGLEEGTSYEIISLNNTGLAVGNNLNEIDNEILIKDDLGAEGNFITLNNNPYIETGTNSGFEIISYTETTVTYTITVYNKKPNENIDVTLTLNENNLISPKINNNLTETKTYSSHLIDSDEENNKYTYEVTNLNDNTDYTFYSLDNSGLAIGSSSEEIDDQIILTDELFVNPNLLFFKTYESKIPNYVWIILIIFLIIIIFIGILLLLRTINKNKEKKIDREINNLAGERINKKVIKNKKNKKNKKNYFG